MYKLVALLPLKAHSERVKNKNFRSFAGRPLFQWVLSTLLDIPEIEMIVINTDARTLLLENGLPTSDRILLRDRPKPICGDDVSMNRIIEDDLQHVESDSFLMTHTTNPLLSCTTIHSALDAYKAAQVAGTADSLFSVNRHQARFYHADGSAINHDPHTLVRTQDLEPMYEENSNLYLFSKTSFRATNARIGTRPLLHETPRAESVDIDDEDSWRLAESLALSPRNIN